MTELLSREKEFLKLNEQLDKWAAAALDQQQQQGHKAVRELGGGESPAPKLLTTQERFHTFTKSKGPSTLLKKRGAGDGVGDLMNTAMRATTQTRTVKPPTQTLAPATRMVQSNATNGRLSVSPRDGRRDPPPLAVNSQRKPMKTLDTSTRCLSRLINRPIVNNPTFTVKYRNPKFVSSPSLEALVKEGGAALKRNSDSVTDLESVSSSHTDAVGTASTATGASTSQRPLEKKQISADGLIKFLKSKIGILEEDHTRIVEEMARQKEILERTLDRQKKVEQQRDHTLSRHNTIAEQLSKLEAQLEEANRRIKETTLEHTTQQKELETAKRELKVLTQTNSNLEKRLYRANEELENAKNSLTLLKNAERDLKEKARTDNESKDQHIKSLKKQRADLLNAYKKQLFLIDNLKRQTACLEQAQMLGFGEKEFTKVLDWSDKP